MTGRILIALVVTLMAIACAKPEPTEVFALPGGVSSSDMGQGIRDGSATPTRDSIR